jgi:hypothetical protein
MERRSDKHSPRVDEVMRDEVESVTRGAPVEARAQESRLKEDLVDEELPADEVPER